MSKQFIGKKMVNFVEETTETTPGGSQIMKVTYADESVEHLSKMMFDKVISSERCDETQLRDKRIRPVVEQVLVLLREWGIKVNETSYFGQLLNQSLDHNTDQALLKLVSKYLPKPLSLGDIDLIAIDRILKENS